MDRLLTNAIAILSIGLGVSIIVYVGWCDVRYTKRLLTKIVGKHQGIVFTTRGVPHSLNQIFFEIWKWTLDGPKNIGQIFMIDHPFTLGFEGHDAGELTISICSLAQITKFKVDLKNHSEAVVKDATYTAYVLNDKLIIDKTNHQT